MKRFLMLVVVAVLLSGCSQLSIYDEYIQRWNLDLPRPAEVNLGKLIKNLPKEYDDFDLIFTYHEDVRLQDKDICKELSDEERYEMIARLYELYKFKDNKTTEEKRIQLEEFLEIDLGPGAMAYKGVTQREHVLLLPRVNPLEIYMLRTLN
ncbi:MAG: hypothetical protein GX046_03005 [Tissierellia bacterium]|nr:hypothetical protein [Tissierellia bacterium]